MAESIVSGIPHTFVCSHELHAPSYYPPPTLLPFSVASHTVLIGFSGAYP